MLEMFLLCTGSLNAVLLLMQGRARQEWFWVCFFFFPFRNVIVAHLFQHDVDSETFFLAHGKCHILFSCI